MSQTLYQSAKWERVWGQMWLCLRNLEGGGGGGGGMACLSVSSAK